ncbi:replication-associated recombination protein A [Mycoplasmopsis anatis]
MYNIANELRPKTLDQIIGQENTVQLLKEVAKNKLATSFIFFGESGTGKTSAAVALANDMNLKYSYFNSTIESKNDLMNKINNSDILIIDEIHRLNKDKQDILLSYLEFDKIIVYATTTENPYFRVNPALRSRMQIVRFEKINEHTIAKALEKVVQTYFPYLDIGYEELLDLSRSGAGDYRSALNNLQMLAMINNKKLKLIKKQLKKSFQILVFTAIWSQVLITII